MVNGTDLKQALLSGANNIQRSRTAIDELNIFPVPDGDTGTNMSMTMAAAAAELETLGSGTGAGEAAKKAASALLRGARGNSGVILSLLFRGFAKGIEGMDEVTGADLANALGLGVEAAYKAVMKPTEGTILTVARLAYESGKAAASVDEDPAFVWAAVCKGAAEALEETPEQLPVLKRAGVVDAGGKGLCVIFDGMLSVWKDGVVIPAEDRSAPPSLADDEFFRNAAAEFDEDIRFTYCTELIVGRDPACETDPQALRAYFESIGDCVLVVDDDEIIKTHVHTENPGAVLQKALEFGQLLTVKVENMKEQHRRAAEENERAKVKAAAQEKESLAPAEPVDEVGFVAVAAGAGLRTLFTDLGCAHIVDGGQTMNPSTADLLTAVLATPAQTVVILPNNKNIILAAEQVIPLAKDRRVVVLPSRTIPQGLSAMLAYDPDADLDACLQEMEEAMQSVSTGQITFAARDSEFGGMKMKEGEILALENGKVVSTEKDPCQAAVKLAKSMIERDTSFVTLIYGDGITEAQAEEVYERIKSKAGSDVEITLVNGGQPVYYFILSVE